MVEFAASLTDRAGPSAARYQAARNDRIYGIGVAVTNLCVALRARHTCQLVGGVFVVRRSALKSRNGFFTWVGEKHMSVSGSVRWRSAALRDTGSFAAAVITRLVGA